MTKRKIKKLKKRRSTIPLEVQKLSSFVKDYDMSDPQLDVGKQGYSVSETGY